MEAKDTEIYVNEYDVGLLNDYGGGDVVWWHNYIRVIGEKAREHYQEQSNIQAEISFKAGRKDVVGFIVNFEGDEYIQIPYGELRLKLKKWGIE